MFRRHKLDVSLPRFGIGHQCQALRFTRNTSRPFLILQGHLVQRCRKIDPDIVGFGNLQYETISKPLMLPASKAAGLRHDLCIICCTENTAAAPGCNTPQSISARHKIRHQQWSSPHQSHNHLSASVRPASETIT